LTFWLQIVYSQLVVLARAVGKAAAKMRWQRQWQVTRDRRTLNHFEAGPRIGSMTSLQKTEKAKFGKILSKATNVYQTAENK
jgi:hypothetical protein